MALHTSFSDWAVLGTSAVEFQPYISQHYLIHWPWPLISQSMGNILAPIALYSPVLVTIQTSTVKLLSQECFCAFWFLDPESVTCCLWVNHNKQSNNITVYSLFQNYSIFLNMYTETHNVMEVHFCLTFVHPRQQVHMVKLRYLHAVKQLHSYSS